MTRAGDHRGDLRVAAARRGDHVTAEVLREYVEGHLPAAALAGVEGHVDGCPECREELARLSPPARYERLWSTIDEILDEPRRGPAERALIWCGVSPETARLVAATPALRRSWTIAAGLVLFTAALVARLSPLDSPSLLLLAISPMLPVLGVAVSFGRRFDPTYEITLVAPVHGLRLALLRTAAVLGVAAGLAAAASLVLPRSGPATLAWLLPMLALTLVTLAMTARVDPVVAAAVTGVGWLALLLATTHFAGGRSLLLTTAGQAVVSVVAVAAAVGLALARRRFDQQPTAVLTP
ncbi:zf-HC2 domain-containing protein [Micromonospora sp. NPDC049301]|uniref:zf-HC2 domain-containing protein n=1 Tax=Micromonospora sp. NPDC049301 TaxID=3155723 RepID=UPI00343144AD